MVSIGAMLRGRRSRAGHSTPGLRELKGSTGGRILREGRLVIASATATTRAFRCGAMVPRSRGGFLSISSASSVVRFLDREPGARRLVTWQPTGGAASRRSILRRRARNNATFVRRTSEWRRVHAGSKGLVPTDSRALDSTRGCGGLHPWDHGFHRRMGPLRRCKSREPLRALCPSRASVAGHDRGGAQAALVSRNKQEGRVSLVWGQRRLRMDTPWLLESGDTLDRAPRGQGRACGYPR